jgi:hypothetical protein
MPIILTSTTQTADQMQSDIEAMGYDPSEIEIEGSSVTVTPAEEKDPPAPTGTEKVVEEGKTAAASEAAKPGEELLDDKDPASPKGLLKRIDKLTARNKNYEADNAALKARLDALDEKAKPAVAAEPVVQAAARPVAPARPLLGDFPEYSDYEAALGAFDVLSATFHEELADWKMEQKLTETRKADQIQNTVQDAAIERNNAWVAAVDAARADLPDFDEVAKNLIQTGTSPTLSPAMADAIVESDVAPYVAHYLATHLDEAERICKATAYDPQKTDAQNVMRLNRVVAREIQKIELLIASEKLSAAEPAKAAAPPPTPTQKSSKAPAPIRPGGSRSVTAPGIEPEMDFKEYSRVRGAQIAEQRKRAA